MKFSPGTNALIFTYAGVIRIAEIHLRYKNMSELASKVAKEQKIILSDGNWNERGRNAYFIPNKL